MEQGILLFIHSSRGDFIKAGISHPTHQGSHFDLVFLFDGFHSLGVFLPTIRVLAIWRKPALPLFLFIILLCSVPVTYLINYLMNEPRYDNIMHSDNGNEILITDLAT